jgi:hypothetical protein
MKRNLRILVIIVFWHCLTLSLCLGSNRLNCPIDNPSIELLNIRLNIHDLPANSLFLKQNIMRKAGLAGWIKVAKPQTWNDYAPGLIEFWKIGNAYYACQYGFFDTQIEAQTGAENAIEARLGAESDPVTKQNTVSFDGQILGDKTFSWNSEMERQYGGFVEGPNNEPFPGEFAGLAYSSGLFACAIHAGGDTITGGIDKELMENLAFKVLKKIGIANSLGAVNTQLNLLISNKGILNSLQVKLDNYAKHYQAGEYSKALNNIDSFINELNTQRGKHVSELACQTLRSYADPIVQCLTELMN